MNEYYNIRQDILNQLRNKSSSQISDIYMNMIKGKMEIIKKGFPDVYEETTLKLYNKHYFARVFYFKACRIWLKFPSFLAKMTKFIVDFFYRRSLEATRIFYKHIEDTLNCTDFLDKVCTVEALKWSKTIEELIGRSNMRNEELIYQS